MAIFPTADKEVLNVRNLPNHANHPSRRNLHGQDVTTSACELVNGFLPLATETGQWLYFAPADVKRVQFTPVPAEQTEQ